jgi:hypothetical protein
VNSVVDRPRYVSDSDVDAALRMLSGKVRFPETPALAPSVRARLEGRGEAPARPAWPFRQFAAVAATLAVLIIGATFAIPASRTAIADWFDLPGVTIIADDPEVQPVLGVPLDLGEPVSLDQARSEVKFQVLVPKLDWLGEPDEVYLDRNSVGGAVSFVYHADDDLPAAEETGVGLLLTQFQGHINPEMYVKGTPKGVEVERVVVNRGEALWISGEPHTIWFIDAERNVIEDTLRFAGNTLLWRYGDLTLRLESALDFETALEIAGSMR